MAWATPIEDKSEWSLKEDVAKARYKYEVEPSNEYTYATSAILLNSKNSILIRSDKIWSKKKNFYPTNKNVFDKGDHTLLAPSMANTPGVIVAKGLWLRWLEIEDILKNTNLKV